MKLFPTRTFVLSLALAALALAPRAAQAQLTFEQAQVAMDAAEAEARANGWNLTILIVDAEGSPSTCGAWTGRRPGPTTSWAGRCTWC
jgi:hypothetical protein